LDRLLERRQRLFCLSRIDAAELKHGDGLDLPSDKALSCDVLLSERKHLALHRDPPALALRDFVFLDRALDRFPLGRALRDLPTTKPTRNSPRIV
jgi:hypothetical protein